MRRATESRKAPPPQAGSQKRMVPSKRDPSSHQVIQEPLGHGRRGVEDAKPGTELVRQRRSVRLSLLPYRLRIAAEACC
jgi:hypothetical protein